MKWDVNVSYKRHLYMPILKSYVYPSQTDRHRIFIPFPLKLHLFNIYNWLFFAICQGTEHIRRTHLQKPVLLQQLIQVRKIRNHLQRNLNVLYLFYALTCTQWLIKDTYYQKWWFSSIMVLETVAFQLLYSYSWYRGSWRHIQPLILWWILIYWLSDFITAVSHYFLCSVPCNCGEYC